MWYVALYVDLLARPPLTLEKYLFDARKFDRATNVLKGHVHAVMDVEFSPTGEKLVSASYVSRREHQNLALHHLIFPLCRIEQSEYSRKTTGNP